MRLAPGTFLGRYEITSLLGVGGMGEVYRATDPRLKRSVAIKVLPSGASGNDELRARVRREARAVAAFKHPHICVLYDVAELDGAECLVMEYLEGETLAARLRRGPVPLTEALRYAVEIASALEAAHREGIVHRDLKPGNVMLTATGTKLLDFGLAKRTVLATDMQPGAMTIRPMTARAEILGTLGYMAPEQLRGADADARSDLFALGVTLFELATGRPPFGGGTEADVIAAVLSAEPDASALDAVLAPPLFKRVVLKCLAKSPEARWQTARDLADALRWIESTPDPPPAAAPRRRLHLGLALGGAIALAVATGFAFDSLREPRADMAPMHASIVAPSGTRFTERDITRHPQFALAPDGSRIAFVAERRGEPPLLWVRALDSGTEQPLAGTENASGPFWSPDSRSLAFFARGKLMRMPAGGGATLEIADVAIDVASGTWGADGSILFAAGSAGGLFRVAADGGLVTAATELDAASGENSHRWPQLLPDGRRFLYYSRTANGGHTYLAELGTTLKQPILATTANVVYAPSGHLLFEREGTLVRQRFDAASGELVGAPSALGDRVLGLRGPSYLPVSAAANGLLAYWRGTLARTELQWFDRTGRPLGVIASSERVDAPQLSPDATRLLVTQRFDSNQSQLWHVDLASGLWSQLTFTGGVGRFGIWSPDGRSAVFSAARESGVSGLNQMTASGAGAEATLPGIGNHYGLFPDDWSRDGRWVVYSATQLAWDIYALDVPNATARPVVATAANEVQARVSPDGRWLAYSSDESGAWEVYVRPFPEGEGKWRVSARGGAQALWRGDGRELYYLAADGRLMAVPVGASSTFERGVAAVLFQTRVPPMLAPFRMGYTASPDGERFLLNNLVAEDEPVSITLVGNWQARN